VRRGWRLPDFEGGVAALGGDVGIAALDSDVTTVGVEGVLGDTHRSCGVGDIPDFKSVGGAIIAHVRIAALDDNAPTNCIERA
jgi:hypothetical protein